MNKTLRELVEPGLLPYILLLLFASLLALPGTLESLGYSSKELTIWGESKTQP